MHLTSADPMAAPSMDPGYLQHPEDAPRLLSAISRVRQIASDPGFSKVIVEEALPGIKRSTPSALLRAIQTFAQSIYHPVGTCRMGMDQMSVVGPTLRIHGISNLHVADASVLPDLPSANTQAVTLLLAARKFVWLRDGSD